MKLKLFSLAALALLAGPMTASAALLSSTLYNVTIGSDVYDVIFYQDSDGFTTFDDVFGSGSPPLTFTSFASAFDAAASIASAADAVNFEYTPTSSLNGFSLFYSYSDTDASYVTGWSDDPNYNGAFGPFTAERDAWLTGAIARLSPPRSTSVPEPATLGLLGMGLIGTLVARRKRVS